MTAIFCLWLAATRPTVDTFMLTSKTFDNTRTIRVLLPAGYAQSAHRSYPVLYLNDGSMVFRQNAIDVATLQNIPPIIIVGIDNGASTDKSSKERDDRAAEFLPYPDAGFPSHTYAPDPAEPRGKSYPAFLDEVMHAVEAKYRVRRDAASTGIGGFSYGGVAALYAVVARQGRFGKLLIESTPLWIGPDRKLLADARRARSWPSRVYIGVGTNEAKGEDINAEGRADIEALVSAIRDASPATAIKSVAEEGGTHSTQAWRRRLPAALDFLFGKKEAARGGLDLRSLERATGLEPATSTLARSHSTN